MSEFDDDRLVALLREYIGSVDALDDVVPRDEPRLTLELAEHKSLAGMAVRRRLLELGWTPPSRRPGTAEPSEGRAPAAGEDVDVATDGG